MGFSAFGTNFSTYNPPYLYLLYLILRINPDLPPVIGVKIPGLISDFICAYFVFRIVQLQYNKTVVASLAGIAVLLAPTMIVNSAYWGQADSIYTAALAACLYYLMKGKPTLAMLAYGISLAFKLQAIFLAPLLFVLFLKRIINWKQVFIIPAVLFLSLVPSWIAGRSLIELLNIYLFQSSQFESITMNAPSIYTWIPQTKQFFNLFYIPGVITGAVMAFFLATLLYKSRAALTPRLLLEWMLISMMVIPFFLPKMHERYFFPADVFSIAFAFYFPQFFYVALAMNGISFLAYEPYLFNAQPIPLTVLTFGLFLLICLLVKHAAIRLYKTEADQVVSG